MPQAKEARRYVLPLGLASGVRDSSSTPTDLGSARLIRMVQSLLHY